MRRLLLVLALLSASMVGPAPAAHAALADPRNIRVSWTRIAFGLAEPVAMVSPPGDGRMFVVERAGRIRVREGGTLLAKPFLDIRHLVNTSGEGGLLGLAFRPDYKTSGRFFVAYTDSDMALRIRRFRALSPTSNTASTNYAEVINVPHPGATNHNGGQLAFGPGGYLFVSTGDGGGTGDPNGNAQNLNSLLGKILRIDVVNYRATRTTSYSIPRSNPYYKSIPGRGEIWASGLRNPWRFSFDIGTSWLYVGDVGQGAREEVDRFHAPGKNLGWDCREGTVDTSSQYGGSYCKTSGYLAPISEYDHSLGCAVIGGHTYRGRRYAAFMNGHYLFGDYCSGRLWLLGPDSAGRTVRGEVGTFPDNVLAFARDAANELYLLSSNGGVYRLAFAQG